MNHYVYVHTRSDTGAVFYVGKGSGARARVRQGRNPFWHAVVAKAGGYDVETVVAGVDEELALFAEVELIDALRRRGARLTNLTDGGEGMTGYKVPADVIARRVAKTRGRPNPNISAALRGKAKSAEHRRNLSESKKGRRASDEARARMSAARKGRPSSMLGKRHSAASKAKTSAALRGERNPFFGRTHSPEAMARIVAANVGRKDSPETRARKSAARSGEKNPRFGVAIPNEQKQRQIAALAARARLTCPHCAMATTEGNAKRWHFDNCKAR